MILDFGNAEPRRSIKGYGASACWWSQNVGSEKTAEELRRLLYDEKGLGLDIYRYNIGGGWDESNCRVKNPWRRCESFYIPNEGEEAEDTGGQFDFTRDKNAYAFMKRCVENGTAKTVILFANSPHYSLTSSGQASGSLIHHTCNLPLSNYERYADYFLDITEHFLQDGIPVRFISPINEPQWRWGGSGVWQEGCHYEPQEVRRVFHIFAKKLEERGLDGVLLYGPESGEIGGLTREYLRLFKADRLIMKRLGAFALHSYHADNDTEIRRSFYKKTTAKNPDIRFDMSEWCELPCRSSTNSIKSALIAARVIGRDLCDLGAESWSAWVAANQTAAADDGNDYSDGLISASDDFERYSVCKRYYALMHFTKFAPPGSRALKGSVKSGDMSLFLFEDASKRRCVTAVNEGAAQVIELGGIKKCDIAFTDESRNFEYRRGVEASSVEAPERSVTSIRIYGE